MSTTCRYIYVYVWLININSFSLSKEKTSIVCKMLSELLLLHWCMCTCLYKRHIKYVNSGVMKSKFMVNSDYLINILYFLILHITRNKESFFISIMRWSTSVSSGRWTNMYHNNIKVKSLGNKNIRVSVRF